MKRLIFTLSTLMICSASMMAIPAKPGQWKMLKLANGTEVRAELVGDELCHYWLANDGKGYAWSAAQGCYVAIDKEAAHKEADQKRNAANKRRMAKATKAKANNLYTGEKKGLIILVEFPKRTATNTPEVKFSTENAQEFYNRVANEEGFSDPKTGFTESVYDYFLAQSSGKFKFKFDVVGPYKLGNTYNYYGEDSGGMQDAHLGKFIYDACRKADGDVNFADYDWDGDGKVDQLFILYAGQGQNVNGADTGLIWPQEGSLNSVGSDQQPFEMDGVTIDSYACSCELGENKVIDGIGTICHEFSHCFGLPDTYDKGTSFGQTELKYGTYVWDLMNNGNYLNGGYTPAAYTALERMLTGWKEPIVLDKDADIVNMKPVKDSIVATLPAHSVLIMKAEAQQRIEPSRYEAEWGYLPCYDNLDKSKRQVLYANNPDASCGMMVSYLGGRKENLLRWDKVYSEKGGNYDMLITYLPAEHRGIQVAINGKTINMDNLKTTGKLTTVTVPVQLTAGYNIIEIGNPYAWAMDIDKFELKAKK